MVQLQQAVSTISLYQFPYLLMLFQVGRREIELIRHCASVEKKFKITQNLYGETNINFVCESGKIKLELMYNTDKKLQISVTSIRNNVSTKYKWLFENNTDDNILCIDATDGKIDVTGQKVTMVFDLGVLYIWIKAGILHMVYNEDPISPNKFAILRDEANVLARLI